VKALFDQGVPAPLRKSLIGREVETAYERGWSSLQNGALITAAESAGFAVFVTTDRNLKYQQNLVSRTLAIVALSTTSWPRIQKTLPAVVAAVDAATAGSYIEVEIE
jgi:hypothetical protein